MHDDKESDTGGPAAGANDRRTLVRDVVVLQLKLVVDGFRDLLLVPASLIAGLASLLDSHKGRPGTQFYDVLELGKRSEHWIDLFGALRERDEPEPTDDGGLDRVIDRMEAYVVDEYQSGGLTRQAKDRIDRALDALQSKKPPTPL